MTIWKLSLKTEHIEGYDPIEVFKEKSLIGVGWHSAYIHKHPNGLAEAIVLFSKKYERKWGNHARTLIEKVQKNDFVWIHQRGIYYLCKVLNDNPFFGKDIDEDFAKYDLGHAREVSYVEVPERFVSGRIQRGVIAQRTIQRINLTEKEKSYISLLFDRLKANSEWSPDLSALSQKIELSSERDFFSGLSPDDTEDIVAAYLQSIGWVIVKSTCFKSKSNFEFEMLNKNEETGYIQIKTGSVSLNGNDYIKFLAPKIKIILFSINISIPSDRENIEMLSPSIVHRWVKNNIWALPLSLRYRLAISL